MGGSRACKHRLKGTQGQGGGEPPGALAGSAPSSEWLSSASGQETVKACGPGQRGTMKRYGHEFE